jgi:hypothetical protein
VDQGEFNFEVVLKPGERGVFERRRPMNPVQERLANELFEKLSATGRMIEMDPNDPDPAMRPKHVANLTFPTKKDGSLRPCVDESLINSKVEILPVGVPSVQEVKDRLDPKKNIFVVLDLANGFNTIPLKREAIPYACVWGPNGQIWAYTVMTFGWTNAPQHFRNWMSYVLAKLKDTHFFVDDILIESTTVEFTVKKWEYILTDHTRTWLMAGVAEIT